MSREADRPVVVARGSACRIEYAVRANGVLPAKDFMENLDDSDKRKLAALFQRMANHGTVPNREQFKKVKDGIFEFKKHQLRVFCFRVGTCWYLTNGYRKKKDRLDRAEIDRADQIRAEHVARMRGESSGR